MRHLYTTLDVDKSGTLSWDELKTGFAKHFNVDALAEHVEAKMREAFDKVAKPDASGTMALGKGVFSRFYAEVLFRHFDKDNSGTLQLAEFQEALGHMVKPNADGTKTLPIIAFPESCRDETGEVHLPVKWFWATFAAME